MLMILIMIMMMMMMMMMLMIHIRLAKENWCVGLGGPGRGKVWVSRSGVHCHPHHCNQHHCHPHHCNQHHCHHDHQSGY